MFEHTSAVVCRYDAEMNRSSDSQSVDVAPSVADYSSVANLSHTKQCILHTDLSFNVAPVCGVLLPRIQGNEAKVWNEL